MRCLTPQEIETVTTRIHAIALYDCTQYGRDLVEALSWEHNAAISFPWGFIAQAYEHMPLQEDPHG